MADTAEGMTKPSSFPWGAERPRQRRDRLRGRVATVARNLVWMLAEHGERAVVGAEQLEGLLADLAEAEARLSGGSGAPAWLPPVKTVREEFLNAGLVLEELAALDAATRRRIVEEMAAAARKALGEA